MASVGQSSELQSVVALVKTMTNAQLKEILRSEGLAVSGKANSFFDPLVIERLNQGGQIERYDNLKRAVYATTHRSMPQPSTPQSLPSHQYHSSSANQPLSTQQRPSPLSAPMTSHGLTSGRLNFKESPFYTVFQQLTPVVECKVREQTRDSVELRVVLNQDVASRLQADPNLRVMVYCAADTGLNQYTKSDIAFPHQVELKANLDEVKANLRGLKNKPDVEQVVVEPDGRWSNPRVVDASEAGGVTPESDDDDLIEIRELGNTPVKQESLPAASLSLQRTPAQSREPSSTSSVARLSTNKRPAAQVIDLTGSDDDNDDGSPVRPPKRPALNLLNRSLPRQEFQSSYNTALANGKAVPRAGQTSSESATQTTGYNA
ncbi:PINIT domain protein [Aspergillus parasiticus SU-1]|uniref:PINIT domain protein n=1 Tax=Aspergillus parasiticus (strain ATCC 56775 / NRRL 5862 / SRRC 143 / SU-1) TaxID=1403190 RepID=A0A0F0I9T0_ASPPU|nr:PINIT domain protein [Aspergillus parasiticus SU-1]